MKFPWKFLNFAIHGSFALLAEIGLFLRANEVTCKMKSQKSMQFIGKKNNDSTKMSLENPSRITIFS